MERDTVKKSIKIESPENNGWLDSPLISHLDELSSRLYFWVDKNVIVRGNYDINNNNGPLINTLAHAVFKLRKAVPAAKELYQAGYLNPQGITRIAKEYITSFRDGRIQPFKDEYGNDYCALNLNLADPSVKAITEHIKNTD